MPFPLALNIDLCFPFIVDIWIEYRTIFTYHQRNLDYYVSSFRFKSESLSMLSICLDFFFICFCLSLFINIGIDITNLFAVILYALIKCVRPLWLLLVNIFAHCAWLSKALCGRFSVRTFNECGQLNLSVARTRHTIQLLAYNWTMWNLTNVHVTWKV